MRAAPESMTTWKRSAKLDTSVRAALPNPGSALLAVSGGLDSMVLLDVAVRLARRTDCSLMVATFDHASGAHSSRAASFVASRAFDYGLPVVIGRAESSASSEAGWRAARWGFLQSVAASANAVVLTAHTRDDQLETVLMRVLRGAGARGLAGLYGPSVVRRPLIELSRAELHRYALQRNLEWIEDPTNRSMRYLRNRVRRDLLPALLRVRPNLDADLLDLASRAAEWRADLRRAVDEGIRYQRGTDEGGAATLDVAADDLSDYSRPMLGVVWPELASRAGLILDARGTRRAAEFTISSRVGGRIQLSGGWELGRSRTLFELRAVHQARVASQTLAFQPPMVWDQWTFRVDEGNVPGGPWSASFPAGEDLIIRAWQPGDRLTITHAGRLIARKVKYFLSDAGISGHIRRRWPVVVAGGEIVWIPGVRRSDAATARSGRPAVTYVCDYLDRRS